MEQHPLNFSPTIFGIIMHFGPITVVCCLLAKSSSQLREVVMETDHFFPPIEVGADIVFLKSHLFQPEIPLLRLYFQS